MRNALLESGVLPLHTEFSIAGVRCDLSTNSAAILTHLSRFTPVAPGGEPSFRVSVLELAVGEDQSSDMHFRGMKHFVFALLGAGNRFVLDFRRRHAAGIVSCAVILATCCIALIPYLGTVIMLPIFVCLRTFGLRFIRQFGSDYDLWASIVEAPPAAPPIPPPLQT